MIYRTESEGDNIGVRRTSRTFFFFYLIEKHINSGEIERVCEDELLDVIILSYSTEV